MEEGFSYWPQAIVRPKVLLTEGRDAFLFCVWAVRAYGLSEMQVIDYGGVAELPKKLKLLKLVTGYDRVESLAVIRDAETDAEAALESVRAALAKADLPVPKTACEIEAGRPSTAIFLFPGLSDDGRSYPSGTLEDLCLVTVSEERVLACIDAFLDCLRQTGCDVKRPHKARVHAYLAAIDKFVGLKLGEAAKAGAWDWQHPSLRSFQELLRAL